MEKCNLAVPDYSSQTAIFIGFNQEIKHSVIDGLKRFNMMFVEEVQLNENLLYELVKFTISSKMSPVWNAITDDMFVYGQQFVMNYISMPVVTFGIQIIRGKIYFTIKPEKIKFVEMEINKDKYADNLINGSSFELVYVLPNLQRGYVTDIHKSFPPMVGFREYKQFRQFYQNIFGYWLPQEETDIFFISIKPCDHSSNAIVFPSCCVKKCPPLFSRISAENRTEILNIFLNKLKKVFDELWSSNYELKSINKIPPIYFQTALETTPTSNLIYGQHFEKYLADDDILTLTRELKFTRPSIEGRIAPNLYWYFAIYNKNSVKSHTEVIKAFSKYIDYSHIIEFEGKTLTIPKNTLDIILLALFAENKKEEYQTGSIDILNATITNDDLDVLNIFEDTMNILREYSDIGDTNHFNMSAAINDVDFSNMLAILSPENSKKSNEENLITLQNLFSNMSYVDELDDDENEDINVVDMIDEKKPTEMEEAKLAELIREMKPAQIINNVNPVETNVDDENRKDDDLNQGLMRILDNIEIPMKMNRKKRNTKKTPQRTTNHINISGSSTNNDAFNNNLKENKTKTRASGITDLTNVDMNELITRSDLLKKYNNASLLNWLKLQGVCVSKRLNKAALIRRIQLYLDIENKKNPSKL